jgi:hypothetical protein
MAGGGAYRGAAPRPVRPAGAGRAERGGAADCLLTVYPVHTLNAVDPQLLKPPGFNPCTYEVKNPVSKLCFLQIKLVPLRRGGVGAGARQVPRHAGRRGGHVRRGAVPGSGQPRAVAHGGLPLRRSGDARQQRAPAASRAGLGPVRASGPR